MNIKVEPRAPLHKNRELSPDLEEDQEGLENNDETVSGDEESQAVNYVVNSWISSSTRKRVAIHSHISLKKEDKVKETPVVSEDPSGTLSPKSIICIISLILLLLFAITMYYCRQSPQSEFTADSVIKYLSNSFPEQPKVSMRVIGAALKSIMTSKSEIRRPAVILLVSPGSAENILLCFAKSLTDLLKQPSHYVEVNETYATLLPADAKEKIDVAIKSSFRETELNVALITQLDKLPSEAALMFHGHCDDENAAYKKAVYVMTITDVIDNSSEFNQADLDKAVEGRLRKSWHDLTEEAFASLLVRLTGSVAAILNSKLPKFCK